MFDNNLVLCLTVSDVYLCLSRINSYEYSLPQMRPNKNLPDMMSTLLLFVCFNTVSFFFESEELFKKEEDKRVYLCSVESQGYSNSIRSMLV